MEYLYLVVAPSYPVHASVWTHAALSLSGLSHLSASYEIIAITATEDANRSSQNFEGDAGYATVSSSRVVIPRLQSRSGEKPAPPLNSPSRIDRAWRKSVKLQS